MYRHKTSFRSRRQKSAIVFIILIRLVFLDLLRIFQRFCQNKRALASPVQKNTFEYIFNHNTMLNLVLFGPPGAGKGTQSAKIKEKYNLIHLSTGDLLRAEIKDGTALGMQAKALMDKGELVPDAIVIGMIAEKLKANAQAAGFIFDGFPRTVAQAVALDALLNGNGTPISGMVALEVDKEELTQRILKRGETSGRADDQNEDLIRTRVSEYEQKTAPVAGHYKAQNKYVAINGVGEIEEIYEALCAAIDKLPR